MLLSVTEARRLIHKCNFKVPRLLIICQGSKLSFVTLPGLYPEWRQLKTELCFEPPSEVFLCFILLRRALQVN